MLRFEPSDGPAPGYRVLCLGAHADDIEIGCGGTIISLLKRYPQSQVYWVVLSAHGERAEEAQASAEKLLRNAAAKEIVTRDFRESFFPYVGERIKEYFEQIKAECSPDLVLTHYRSDLHQDHRLVSELTWNTFRGHFILEYEIPKYDGDLGSPNTFVPLPEATCREKVQHIVDAFKSQRYRTWFDPETFMGLLRLRGVECGAPTRYAEAFYGRKVVVGLTG